MYIKKKILKNGAIIPSNYSIDINLKTNVDYEFNEQNKKGLLLYPQIKLIFYPNGYIYLYYGNYLNYKSKQFGPNIGVKSKQYKYQISNDFDTNLSESYYSFVNGVLSFNSNNILYKSWKLQLNLNNDVDLNLYLTNFNQNNNNISNLNFKLIFSSNDDFKSNNNNIYLNCSFGYFDFGPINLIENVLILNKYLIKNYAETNLKNNFMNNFDKINPKKILTKLNKNFLSYNCNFLPVLSNPYKIVLDAEFKKEYIKNCNICSKKKNSSSNSNSNSNSCTKLDDNKKNHKKNTNSKKHFLLKKLNFMSDVNMIVYFMAVIGIILFIVKRHKCTNLCKHFQ